MLKSRVCEQYSEAFIEWSVTDAISIYMWAIEHKLESWVMVQLNQASAHSKCCRKVITMQSSKYRR